MAKVYLINCRDVGVDCDHAARGSSIDEVMQCCAEHAIREHSMKGFGRKLYAKMRRGLRRLEEGTSQADLEGTCESGRRLIT